MSTLLWLICLAALALACVAAPNGVLWGMLGAWILAPILSWVLMLPVRNKIRIRFTAPGVVGKKKPFPLEAELSCKSRLPMGKATAWLRLTNHVTGETARRKIKLHGSGAWMLESTYCGGMECQVIKLWCYDLFGVLPLPVPCKAKKRIVVMPDTFPVEVDCVLSVSEQTDCTEYSPDRKGSDHTETYQIRDYVPGDSLQQVHWKLSSKLDRLMVREPSLPVDRELLIFLDRTADTIEPDRADAVMEAVTSVCQAFSEVGQPFVLAWNEDGIVQYEITNKEQLPEAIGAMLTTHAGKSDIPGGQLYQKTFGDKKTGSVLYFCMQPPGEVFPSSRTQVFLCGSGDGENIISFTPQTIADKLRRLSWS